MCANSAGEAGQGARTSQHTGSSTRGHRGSGSRERGGLGVRQAELRADEAVLRGRTNKAGNTQAKRCSGSVAGAALVMGRHCRRAALRPSRCSSPLPGTFETTLNEARHGFRAVSITYAAPQKSFDFESRKPRLRLAAVHQSTGQPDPEFVSSLDKEPHHVRNPEQIQAPAKPTWKRCSPSPRCSSPPSRNLPPSTPMPSRPRLKTASATPARCSARKTCRSS